MIMGDINMKIWFLILAAMMMAGCSSEPLTYEQRMEQQRVAAALGAGLQQFGAGMQAAGASQSAYAQQMLAVPDRPIPYQGGFSTPVTTVVQPGPISYIPITRP